MGAPHPAIKQSSRVSELLELDLSSTTTNTPLVQFSMRRPLQVAGLPYRRSAQHVQHLIHGVAGRTKQRVAS